MEEEPDLLVVRIEGQWVGQRALRMLDEAGRECRERGHERVLIDCREMGGHVSEHEKFLAGKRVAERFGQIRVAAVFAPGSPITQFAMSVAAKRGGKLLVTADMDEAKRWLFAGPC